MAISHLFLCGYRGSGKSTAGRFVSDLLGWKFVDTDDLIEHTYGGSIATIFATEGEVGFRNRESQSIESLRGLSEPHVVALGGGAILRPRNRELIRLLGRCVWLRASEESLMNRIAADPNTQLRRPSLSKLGELDEIRAILGEREPLYRQTSDWEISTESVPMEDVARAIAAWYTDRSASGPSHPIHE